MGVTGYGLTGWDREDGMDEGVSLGLVLATAAEYREAEVRARLAEPSAAPGGIKASQSSPSRRRRGR
jgi:hypothetical protein